MRRDRVSRLWALVCVSLAMAAVLSVSMPSAAMAAARKTKISISPMFSVTDGTHPVTVRARLVDSKKRGVRRQYVNVLRSYDGVKWTKWRHIKTSSTGVVQLTAKPSRTTFYCVSFTGTRAFRKSRSTAAKVQWFGRFSASEVWQALAGADLPVTNYQLLSPGMDPEVELGRPGRCVAKASWDDTRLPEPYSSWFGGGIVEVFDSITAFNTRRVSLSPQIGVPVIGWYLLPMGNTYVRLSVDMTPDQVAGYQTALGALDASKP